jgi:hypothetical protein
VPHPLRVFLDNMVWNKLADKIGPVSLDDLVAAYRCERLEVVGSTRILNEIMLAARCERTKYKKMRKLYLKLVGQRILHSLPELHVAEVLAGGRADERERYIPSADRRKLIDITSPRRPLTVINNKVFDQKRQGRTLFQSFNDHLLEALGAVGQKPMDFRLSLDDDNVREHVTVFVEAAQERFNLPKIERANLKFDRVPSAWLYVTVWLALTERQTQSGRRVRETDQLDGWHAAAGAYFDALVTDDVDFRKTLERVDSLPFKIMSTTDLASWLTSGAAPVAPLNAEQW